MNLQKRQIMISKLLLSLATFFLSTTIALSIYSFWLNSREINLNDFSKEEHASMFWKNAENYYRI